MKPIPERMRRNNQQQNAMGPKSELERQMQVVIASLRLLSSDVDAIKRNLSILSQTSKWVTDKQKNDFEPPLLQRNKNAAWSE